MTKTKTEFYFNGFFYIFLFFGALFFASLAYVITKLFALVFR